MKFITAIRHEEPEVAVLFAAPFTHAEIAAYLRRDGFAILGAGFCRFEGGGVVTTHDESQSLGIRPRPRDAALIGAMYRATLGSIGLQPVGEAPAPAPVPALTF